MKLSSQLTLGIYRNVKLSRHISLNENVIRHIYQLKNGEDFDQGGPVITQSLVIKKLKESSLSFTDGFTCLRVRDCVLCNKHSKKTKPNKTGIYINKKTGFFLCDLCNSMGNWPTFSKFLDKIKEQPSKGKETVALGDCTEKYEKLLSTQQYEILKSAIPLSELQADEFQNAFKAFNLVLCSKTIAEKLQIKINAEHTQLFFPMFTSNSTLVGYKTIDKFGKVNTYPHNNCPGFLSSHSGHLNAVVVAEVSDFFALASLSLPMEILCLPYGAAHLPQITLPFLEKYEKLILWLGGTTTLETTGNFAKKLNDKRCSIVKPINNQTSALTALRSGENIMQILNCAKSAWHESIISFNSLRDEVLTELQNKDQCTGITWKKFPVLNKILKGHRRGELTVLTGPTGSGKTTFISEYSLDLAMQGVNTLWGSFEIKNSRLVKKMLQQFSGIPMEENLDKFDYWADKFEQLPIYFMTFHGQQSLNVVMDAVEHCSYVYDIAHVIIDNVQFMIDVSPDAISIDRFWKQDVLIQRFRSFASKNNCHVTLVMHPKKGMDGLELGINSIFGGAKAAQEADNILIIQNKSAPLSRTKKFLQISKNRFSGDLGTMPLIFDKNSFGFAKRPHVSQENIEIKESWNTEANLEIDGDSGVHWRECDTEYEEKEASQNKSNFLGTWNRLMTA